MGPSRGPPRYNTARMPVPLTILTDPRRTEPRRELALAPGTTILRAAHAAGLDVTATCGGRGRCTSCRVKFLAGAGAPPPLRPALHPRPAEGRPGGRPGL